ncbi:uracil-DNA glycosylase [Marinibacterium profundimaris]|uniref:Uracil-DNA glycosylase n=1 Tax=Marinibacterium profundimaris TaxID=1679460 RepID=A0A225NKE3_9RHOB|nr:uracil-DNA glycosylase [Marinibacterium profundimaris]OWU74675.1 uracil-DNA glycosylase [Marinibacterium profundimaris]
MLDDARPQGWADLPFFTTDWPAIDAALARETRQILPPRSQVFAALDLCPPDAVQVVILGQDPYPTPGHAHGLAFSAAPDVRPLPRSLSNIYKEMQDDLGACPPNADLRFWARQGVLLLNTVLTVPAGEAHGHKDLGWQRLADQVLARLQDRPRAFLLWGKPAQKIARTIDAPHLKIETAHPSPLSARRGFFGSRPFSRTNAWLSEQGHTPINWTTPEAP